MKAHAFVREPGTGMNFCAVRGCVYTIAEHDLWQCLKPEPPTWALAAGLPEPRDIEPFFAYVKRLGLDPYPLLAGLTEQTAELANLRLRTLLQREMAHEYRAHVEALVSASVEPERRDLLRSIAHNYASRGATL